MKIMGIYSDGVHIEFFNSMWSGKETIKVDGEVVSAKHSFWGTSHYFQVIGPDGEPIDFELRTGMNNGFGVSVDIMRNGVPLLESGGYGNYRGRNDRRQKHADEEPESAFL
jgi:hypothetical protein